MHPLRHIMRYNDLGHPLCGNLRSGTWVLDYVVSRLEKYVTLCPILRTLTNSLFTGKLRHSRISRSPPSGSRRGWTASRRLFHPSSDPSTSRSSSQKLTRLLVAPQSNSARTSCPVDTASRKTSRSAPSRCTGRSSLLPLTLASPRLRWLQDFHTSPLDGRGAGAVMSSFLCADCSSRRATSQARDRTSSRSRRC